MWKQSHEAIRWRVSAGRPTRARLGCASERARVRARARTSRSAFFSSEKGMIGEEPSPPG